MSPSIEISERAIAARTTAPEPATLSVVIVTHNGADHIEECLRSVAEHCPGAEVLVVDNASSDDTLARVRQGFPQVRVVALERNLGYGAAANAGVDRARGRYCLILNQDLSLSSRLTSALEAMERQPRVAVTGGRLRYPDGRPQLTIGFERTAPRVLFSWLIPARLPIIGRWASRMETRPSTYAVRTADVAWVSGALLLCRTSVWRDLGGMDESLFMYCEDVEFCARVRAAGHRVDYEPTAHAVHAEASGRSWVGARALGWTLWNDVELVRRRRGATAAQVLRLGLAGACWIRAGVFRLMGATSGKTVHADKARGYWSVGRDLLLGQAARTSVDAPIRRR